MSDATLNESCFLGLFMSIVFYIGSVCGITLMYLLYTPTLSCTINISVISWMIVLIISMLDVTIHSKVSLLSEFAIISSFSPAFSYISYTWTNKIALVYLVVQVRCLLYSGIMASYIVYLSWSAIKRYFCRSGLWKQ